MRIKVKLTIAFLLISLLSLTVISSISYFIAKKSLTQQILNQLQSVASIQKSRAKAIVDQNLERLVLVSSRTQLRLSLESFIRDPKVEYQDKMNRILHDARSSISSFNDISVLTLDGKVVASTELAKIGGKHSDEEFFVRGQTENSADLFYLDKDKNLRAHLSGPLYLENKLLGVVAIEADVDNIISLVRDYSGLGETGETLLAKRDEDGDTLFVAPLRFDRQAALSRIVSKDNLDDPITQALLKDEKLFTDAVDYRAQSVLAATRYIEKTGWGLVVKMDTAEAFTPITQLRNLLAIIIFACSIVTILISLYLARSITRPVINLTHVARKISEGDLSARAEATSTDEIGTLGQAFNQMAENLVTDIAKRKKSEEALRESEEKYRLLFENVFDVIFSYDQELRVLSVSPSVERVLGYKPEELIGRSFSDLNILAPEYLESAISDAMRIFAGESIESSVYEFIAKDRTRKFCEISGTPLIRDGKVLVGVSVGRDITDKKLAEVALHREKEKFRILVEESPLGVSLIGKDGDYKYVNPKFVEIFGYTLEEIPTGQEWFRKTYPDPEYRNKAISTWITDVKESEPGQFRSQTFTVTCKDGLKKVIQFLPVTMETGDHFIIYDDITEKEKLGAQLRQAQKMEAVGMLAGGVAHDFNNLLTCIIGNADLMLMSLSKDSPLNENIGEIMEAGQRAASLTRQLLAFSRKQVFQPKVLNLSSVVTELKKMLGRLIGEDVKVETFLEPDLMQVEADPVQVQQVIMNLAVNARDAMPRGGKLTIETANIYLDEAYAHDHDVELKPGPYVMLAVSDTGLGMDEKTRSRIFEPFFTTKEKGEGTGLGLSTVYGIVKQSEGYIWVYSEPEQGTTFKIYMPGVEREAEPVKRQQTSLEGLRGSENVLLVEDDKTLRNLAVKVLKQYGYSVIEAQNGEQALSICDQHEGPIYLMITDVVMPGMSGRELGERLQSLRPEIKVLYMSGYTDNVIVHHGVLAPGVNFIEKPFSPEGLVRKVREVLDGK